MAVRMEEPAMSRAEQLHILERTCDAFESQWSSGGSPNLSDYLASTPLEIRAELFGELLALEIAYRSSKAMTVQVDDYLQRFPDYIEIVRREFASCNGFNGQSGESYVPPAKAETFRTKKMPQAEKTIAEAPRNEPIRELETHASAMSDGDQSSVRMFDESIRQRFVAGLASDSPLTIESLLADASHPLFLGTLEELATCELDHLWKQSTTNRTTDPPLVEHYLRRFPQLNSPKIVRRLIQREYAARCLFDQKPDSEEYRQRFRDLPLPGIEAATQVIARSTTSWRSRAHFHWGDKVGRYELHELIGRGGFGDVFRAKDTMLRREVAIKVPRQDRNLDSGLGERMLREARAAARLRHPGVVPIHEVGELEDIVYIVSELIQGATLQAILEEKGTTPLPTMIGWLADVADALHYAHQCGIVHRDIKPANIMIRDGGHPVVMDFGLARQTEIDSQLTQSGDVIGTPAFMAPEQALGQTNRIDARSDVYSLGVVLYLVICDRVPFPGAPATVLRAVIEKEPTRPRKLKPTIPPAVETICLKAIAKEPSRRYESAGAFADDLRRYLRREPILARPTGPFGRVWLWCRREPALALTISLALVLLFSVAFAGYWNVLGERNRFRAERDRAESSLYRALMSDAESAIQARGTGWWWQSVDNIREASKLAIAEKDRSALRELAIRSVTAADACFHKAQEWQGHDNAVTSVRVSPSGKWIVTGGRDGAVRIWSLTGKQIANLENVKSAITDLRIHPNGRIIFASTSDGGLFAWNCAWDSPQANEGFVEATNPPMPPDLKLNLKTERIYALAISPDGKSLVAGCHDSTIRWLTIAPQASHADGKYLVEQTDVLRGHAERIHGLDFSYDGRWLASCSLDQTVKYWETASHSISASWNMMNSVDSVAFSKNTYRLIFASRSAFGFGVIISPETEQPIIRNGNHGDSVMSLGMDSRLRILTASLDGTVRLWDHSGGTERAVARGDYQSARCAVLDPTERFVVAGYQDGAIRVWDLHCSPEIQHFIGSNDLEFLQNKYSFVATRARIDVINQNGSLDVATTFIGPIAITAICPLGKDHEVTVGRDDGSMQICNVESGRIQQEWKGHAKSIQTIAVSPDGKYIASGDILGVIKVWSRDKQALLTELDLRCGAIHQLVWNADSKMLAASAEKGASVWRVSSPFELLWTQRVEPRRMSGIAFGSANVAMTNGNTIELRDPANGKVIHQLPGHRIMVNSVVYAPVQKQFVSVATGEMIRVWDEASRQVVRSAVCPGYLAGWARLDPTGRWLALVHSQTSTVHVWDFGKLRETASLSGQASVGCFDESSGRLIYGTRTGAILGCQLQTLEKIASTSKAAGFANYGAKNLEQMEILVEGGHIDGIWGNAVSPNGKWVATSSHDGGVKLWDANTFRLIRTFAGHLDVAWCAAFSPDSRWLATGSYREIFIWEVETGKLVAQMFDHDQLVTTLAFHPSEPWLISGSLDASIKAFEYNWGGTSDSKTVNQVSQRFALIAQFVHPIHKLVFDPQGGSLAAACEDQHVAVWNWREISAKIQSALVQPRKKKLPQEAMIPIPLKSFFMLPPKLLEGHKSAAWAVTFSKDGKILASGSSRGDIILRDARNLEPIVSLHGHNAPLRALSFSHDGRYLAAGAYNNSSLLWDLYALRATLNKMDLDW